MAVAKKPSMDLVLGGGGIKGFAHIGVIKALIEKQMVIQNIIGVSVGSIIAAFYTNGFTPDDIARQFFKGLARRFCPLLWLRAYSITHPLSFVSGPFLPNVLGPVKHMVALHGLKPQPSLKILAFDVLSRKPVLFQGTDYDLSYALAATCALPGVFQSIPYNNCDQQLLVDGAIYHRNPVEFCNNPAIVSKLGFANKMPDDILPPWEILWHFREVFGSTYQERHDVSDDKNIVIDIATPHLSGLSFSLPYEKCQDLINQGYMEAMKALRNLGK